MSPQSARIDVAKLRAQYSALAALLRDQIDIASLPVAELRARVPHAAALRMVALRGGFGTLGELVAHAANVGHAAFDIEAGRTLAQVVDWAFSNRELRVPKIPTARNAKEVCPPTATDAVGEEAWDSLDLILNAADDLRRTLGLTHVAQWAGRAIDEHIERLVSSTFRPNGFGSFDAFVGLAGRSLRRAAAGLRGDESLFRADLLDALSLFDERTARIAAQRFGLVGPARTLEEIGQAEGVTRERIRQIMSRFETKVARRRPPLLSLALLQAALHEAGALVTAAELNTLLPPRFALTVDDVESIKSLLSLGWLSGIVESSFPGIWVRKGDGEAYARDLLSRVRRVVSRFVRKCGAVDLAAFDEGSPDGVGIALTLLSERGPYEIVDGWAVLVNPCRCAAARRLAKISQLAATISAPRLLRALRKSLKITLPENVLAQIVVREIPATTRSPDGGYSLSETRNVELPRAEALAIELITAAGGATSLRALQRGFVQRGMSAGSAGVAFSRSVVLERIAPGVVGVVGSSPDPALVSKVRRELRKDSSRSLIGLRNKPDGVELLYRIDPLLLSSTLFILPKKRIARGEWRVEGSGSVVTVKSGYIVGLHRFAKRLAQSGARQLSVAFVSEARCVQINGR